MATNTNVVLTWTAALTLAVLPSAAVQAQIAKPISLNRILPSTCHLDLAGLDGSDPTGFPCHEVDVVDWSNGRTSFIAHVGPKEWGSKLVFDFGGLTVRSGNASVEAIDHVTVAMEDKPNKSTAVAGACKIDISPGWLQAISCRVTSRDQSFTLQSTFPRS